MSYDGDESISDYQARRVRLTANVRFETLVAAFEQAVPALPDADAVARLAEDGSWSGFVRGLQWESPSGFVCVWSSRPDELMRSAGSSVSSIVWLIVNHGLAARLFRLEPGAMLYSPIRVEAHAASEAMAGADAVVEAVAETVVTFDVPSAQLRVFGINKITQAGTELDRALGDLIESIGLPRPTALRR
ncbi:hypothetical protein [Rathayibacter soli]|uniref:hypothetical protein n=1 Tax=Rathayibacter soli TaxID=3144168 RepID=UPI0027E48491|nr:hypothetical protein [Glaciibacter superstes]